MAGVHGQTVQAPNDGLPLDGTYAKEVDGWEVIRDFLVGSRPWDRLAAFAAVASHVDDAEPRSTDEAMSDVVEHVHGETSSRLIESLFSPRDGGPAFLRGDTTSYDDPANSFIHSVVRRRVGIPLSLAVIASEAAKERGVDLRVAGMPGHVLLQDGKEAHRYFDVFHGGIELDEDGCQMLYRRLTGLQDWNPTFLAPIDTEQQVFRMLNNLKSIYRRRADLKRLRKVMALRALFPGVEAAERGEFARLMRETN